MATNIHINQDIIILSKHEAIVRKCYDCGTYWSKLGNVIKLNTSAKDIKNE
jgi:hypothetical protein